MKISFYLYHMKQTNTHTMHYTMNDERSYFDTFEFYQYRDNKRCSDDLVGPFTIKGRNKFDAISRASMMTKGTQCNKTFKCIERKY